MFARDPCSVTRYVPLVSGVRGVIRMADGLPAGTVVAIGRGGGAASIGCVASVLLSVTVMLLRSVESISPLNATTICGSTMLTMDPLSGDVVATLKRCT